MAITSEIIGKLGGRVESTPVSVPGLSGSGSSEVMHTVNIPPGETWLVAVVGTGSSGGSAAYLPQIHIGDTRVPQSSGHFASAAIMSESGDVVFRSLSSSTSSFTGHVYTAKM